MIDFEDDISVYLWLEKPLQLLNNMLQQLEDLSVKPSEVVRQTYEHISAHVTVETWTEKETYSVFGKTFRIPEDRDQFLKYLKGKIWCSYRKNFCAIGGTGPTTDSGWGCMLRAGQMMLAEGLVRMNLGKDWTYETDKVKENSNSPYWRLLNQIIDKRSSRYSIQAIAQMGVSENKPVGSWFGPTNICNVIRKLSEFDEQNNYKCHLAMGNTMIIEEIERLMVDVCEADDSNGEPSSASKTNNDSKSTWKPLIMLTSSRIGLEQVNPSNLNHLKQLLDDPCSLGFVGGKPNSAYYFLGHSDENKFVYLDPHITQSVPEFSKPSTSNSTLSFDDSTYHCNTPRRLAFSKLDPCLSLGFFFKTRQSFDVFCQRQFTYENKEPGDGRLLTIVHSLSPFNTTIHTFTTSSTRKKKDANEKKSINQKSGDDEEEDESSSDEESYEILEVIYDDDDDVDDEDTEIVTDTAQL